MAARPSLLLELQALVARYAGTPGGVAPDASERNPHPLPGGPGATDVRAYLRSRRLRECFFAPGLFADPAWDMLLDLWLAREGKCSVSVSSLCIAAAVPPTTALRWICQLEHQGYFVRTEDRTDGRRRHVHLSDHAVASLSGYFDALAPAGLPAVREAS